MSHSWDVLEKPMAVASFGLGALTLVWKSPLGVSWLPVLGPAIEEMFNGKPDGYYPRRGTAPDGTLAADDGTYKLLYFLMYGVLGTAGQWAGLKLTTAFQGKKKKEEDTVTIGDEVTARRARMYGLLHFVIGAHHLVYSLSGSNYGKFEQHRVGLGSIGYGATAVTSVLCLHSASHLLFGTTTSTPAAKVLKRKTVLDTTTIWTLFGMVVCIPHIIAGREVERSTLEVVCKINMLLLPFIMAAGEISET